MQLSKTAWIVVSGLVWFIVGMGLLTLGLNFLVSKAHEIESTSWIARLASSVGGREQAALVLITIGLMIGFFKGRYVLTKTVKRVSGRILALPQPISLTQVYSKGYLLLIAGMIMLGISMKWLKVPLEIRGMVDVAIGSALINGAMAYFRTAFAVKKSH